MDKAKKVLAPVMAGGAAIWSAYNGVAAVQQGRMLRAVFEGLLTLVFVVVTWMLIDTGKRFRDS